MSLSDMYHSFQKFTVDNAPTILTAAGITGTVTTAYLTGQASIDAHYTLKMERMKRDERDLPPPDRKEIVLATWQHFIPPVIAGALTIGSIFWAHRISAHRMAGVAAAYTLSERAFNEYKGKVREKIGEKKEQEYRDEIAQERQDKLPAEGPVIIASNGGILCYDHFTGRYFTSDMENLRKAENDFKETILHDGYGDLSSFYGLLDIPSTDFSGQVGWNTDDKFSLVYSTVLSDDNRPCISIIFDPHPRPDFDRFGPY